VQQLACTFSNPVVDRNRKLIYVTGARIDVSNPRALKWSALPQGGAVAVDPNNGRYATSDPNDGHTLFVYNPDDTLYDAQAMPGQIQRLEVDPATARFFAGTLNENRLVVYRQSSRAVVASVALDDGDATPRYAWPAFDPSSGNLFVNRSFDPAEDVVVWRPLVLDRSYATSAPFEGFVLAADAARGLVYVRIDDPSHQQPSRLEARDSATFALAGSQIDTEAYWAAPDPLLDRLYVQRLHDVAVFDRATGALLTTLPLGDGFVVDGVAFAPGDDRLYVGGFEMADLVGPPIPCRVLVFATR
jgi:hypothetical protein